MVAWALLFSSYLNLAANADQREESREEIEATREEYLIIIRMCGLRQATRSMASFWIASTAYLLAADIAPDMPHLRLPAHIDTTPLMARSEPASFLLLRTLPDLPVCRQQWLKIVSFLQRLRNLCTRPADTQELTEMILCLQDIVAITGHWETAEQKRRRMQFESE